MRTEREREMVGVPYAAPTVKVRKREREREGRRGEREGNKRCVTERS